MRRSRFSGSGFNSINIVPFIDVMLVLLTIVLTTATFIAKGIIPVDLPTAETSEALTQQKQIEIAIKNSGEIFLDGKPIDISGLKDSVKSFDKKDSITIKTDKESAFKYFVEVLEILNKEGLQNISILTKKSE